jgi:predicted permease
MPPQLGKSGAGDYLAEPFVFVPAANGESQLRTRYQQPLTVILVVVGAVLLIACANIANLLLARTAARRRELSLRLALGASRARLARQLVAESLLLSGAGAAIGLALAVWGSGLLVRAIATQAVPASMDLSVDWRVLAFTAGTAVAAALLFGLAPAVGIANVGPQESLKEQGRGVVGDRHAAARNALVVVQVALSLGLVVVAGLFARTFAALTAVPLGFDSQSMLTAHIDLKQSAAGEAGRVELYERLRAAATSVPGITSVSGSIITPVSGSGWNTLIERPVPENSTQKQRLSWVNAISPEWFDTYRMHLLAGRVFGTQDRPGAPRVMIVNQAFVRQFLAGVNPIGQEIQTAAASESRTYEIVGVVNDAVYRSQRTGMAPTLYLPLAQTEHRPPEVMLTARLGGAPAGAVTQAMIEAVGRVDPRATVTFSLIDDQVRATVTRERVVAALASFFGGLALLLAGLGLYGVTAYSVGRRRAEIGIRMALGADAGGVIRLVLRRLAWLLVAGIVMGAVLSMWASEAMATLLFGVTARDPWTFAAGALTLLVAGGMAGWLPARRAARIDPLRALREG